jgi:hypothetical protein
LQLINIRDTLLLLRRQLTDPLVTDVYEQKCYFSSLLERTEVALDACKSDDH